MLVTKGQVSRVVTCYTGEHPILEKKYIDGEIAMEFLPQVKLVCFILLKIS
jgi:acyl CoA:acetate/3-ketoacid CoA transferase alpha subunit